VNLYALPGAFQDRFDAKSGGSFAAASRKMLAQCCGIDRERSRSLSHIHCKYINTYIEYRVDIPGENAVRSLSLEYDGASRERVRSTSTYPRRSQFDHDKSPV
jgi:hypothetical protein